MNPIRIPLLDLYRIGPGPSSSHTVGPMRAAAMFRARSIAAGERPARVTVALRGSLAATGRGHGTDRAVLGGLLGWQPETCDCEALLGLPEQLGREPMIPWGPAQLHLPPTDVIFDLDLDPVTLPHANTMFFQALAADGTSLREETWCSIGGGFVRREGAGDAPRDDLPMPAIPFANADGLLRAAVDLGVGLGDVVLTNERARRDDPTELDRGLDGIWQAFRECADRGLARGGELPGGLRVVRRAREMMQRVDRGDVDEHWRAIARAQAYSYAICEENAAGGRVVTAPTNGAAGIVPAVLLEAAERLQLDRAAIHRAIATAGAIAMVIKTHASLSGAEVGCQGEVGSATAMAAAALCELLGGDPGQVEFAAEIGLEHNLGLTCDPIGGLVQAPCIERNAMGVAKAWSAAQLARHSDGRHLVSLDKVIAVMKRTGDDMRHEYKETSRGGLAVGIPEC